MALQPNIALQVQRPEFADPIASFVKVAQVRNMLTQGQLHQQQLVNEQETLKTHQLANQQHELAAKDDEITRQSYLDAAGDPDKTVTLAAQRGARPQAIQSLQKHFEDITKTKADTGLKQLDIDKQNNELRSGLIQQYSSLPDQERVAAYPQFREAFHKFDPTAKLPDEPLSPEQLTVMNFGHMTEKALNDRAEAQIKLAKEKRDQAAEQRTATEFPVTLGTKQQDLATKQRTDLAGQLALADTPEKYAELLDSAPHGVAVKFPPASQFNPKTTPALVRQIGMTAEQQTAADLNQKKFGQELTDFAEKVRHDKATEGEMRRYHDLSFEGVELTPEAKTKMAEMFAQTGVLPALGNGKAAARTRSDIINSAAKNFPNVDFASNKASFQANSTSLKKLQSQQDAIEGFEKTAGKNLDQFLSTAKDVVDSGIPLINAPLRSIADKMTGSTNQAAFQTARQVAVTEIAKVLNNPQGAGALSDSARHEVQELIGPDATLKQIYKAAQILRTDMKNRKESGEEQIRAIQQRISGKGPEEKAAPSPGSVEDGYRFKGGDPSKQENWEKVK